MKQYFLHFSLNTINRFANVVLFIFAMIFTLLIIYQEYRNFENESYTLRKNYLETQKLKAKDETLRVLNYMYYFYHSMKEQMSEEKLQDSIIRSIEQLFDRKNGSSYIFIYTADGVNVSDPNKSYNRGKNLIGFQDPNGVLVIRDLIEKAKNGGGYVEYVWDNPITKKASPKISYAALFEEWNWMIGTGVYLDEIDEIIEENKSRYKEKLFMYILDILALSFILFLLAYVVIRFISNVIKAEMKTLKNFFGKAATENIIIDKKEIRIGEFQTLVEYVNEMVKTIHERNTKLQEMNLSLEETVMQKTEKLRKQMEYNQQLVEAQDNFIKQSIHEINTPLAVIMTHIDIYKIKYGENTYLNKIEAASKMISTIYEDLSYMIKKDRMVYKKEWIDMKSYVDSRCRFFEEIAHGNEHAIRSELDECGMIHFNELELQRIVDNNLSNAIKYAKRGTDVIVRLKEEGQRVLLEFETQSKKIVDTKKIFEPFHREEEMISGFGLGLEIVGTICHKEAVEIDIDSSEMLTTFSYRFKRRGDESSFT